jgi:hypothetical protein
MNVYKYRYFVKCLLGLWDVTLDRLVRLQLESLEERRLKFDLICVYKTLQIIIIIISKPLVPETFCGSTALQRCMRVRHFRA